MGKTNNPKSLGNSLSSDKKKLHFWKNLYLDNRYKRPRWYYRHYSKGGSEEITLGYWPECGLIKAKCEARRLQWAFYNFPEAANDWGYYHSYVPVAGSESSRSIDLRPKKPHEH